MPSSLNADNRSQPGPGLGALPVSDHTRSRRVAIKPLVNCGVCDACRYDELIRGVTTSSSTARRWPIATAAAASRTINKRHRPVHSRPTSSSSTTWWGTCLSGLRIAPTTITTGRRRTARRAANGDSTNRILRSGSWFNPLDFLHSANRRRFATVARFNKLGFRVGRMLVTP